MIKRPLDPRFSEAVKAGRKVTTIRDAGRVTGTAHDYSCPENIKRYSQPVQPA